MKVQLMNLWLELMAVEEGMEAAEGPLSPKTEIRDSILILIDKLEDTIALMP